MCEGTRNGLTLEPMPCISLTGVSHINHHKGRPTTHLRKSEPLWSGAMGSNPPGDELVPDEKIALFLTGVGDSAWRRVSLLWLTWQ